MILRVAIRLGIVISVTAALLALRLHDDPEHARPPHVERPTAGVETGTSEGERSVFAAAYDLAAQQVTDYLGGLERERQAVAAYLDSLEQARLAAEAAARVAAAQQAPRPTPSSSGTLSIPSSCDGHVVPAYIIQRESGCNYGAVNPTGCGGNGCYGLYQESGAHFAPGGTCAGLDWHSPADQDECARRLVAAGGLAPWGG